MPRADQADRRSGLRPVKCTKKSKQSGEQCKRWATIGTSPPVCHFHGGGRRAVKERADLAVVAAQLGVIGLPPGDTIRLVQRALSDRMLEAAGALRATVEAGRSVDPEEHERFVQASDRALVAARVALAAGVEDEADGRDEETGELVAQAIGWTVDGVLDLLRLGADQRLQVRQYALELATWALQGGDPMARPTAPELLPRTMVAVGELMPAPRRRSVPDADSVWSAAQQIVDAEVVDDEEDDDDDVVADSG